MSAIINQQGDKGDYHILIPNLIMYKDPDTERYLGNAIGSVPLEVHFANIAAAGAAQIEAIEESGAEWISAVEALAKKYELVWEEVYKVMNAIIISSGEVFVLDKSALDSETELLY